MSLEWYKQGDSNYKEKVIFEIFVMIIHWKNVIISGVCGLACGGLYGQIKRDPDLLWSVGPLSCVAGITGSALGLGIGWYRNRPAHVYSISLGGNFAIAMLSFLGIRYYLVRITKDFTHHSSIPIPRHYMTSGTSGFLVGTVFSLISRNPLKSMGLCGFGGLGSALLGQYVYDNFEVWRKHKAIEVHYPDLFPDHVHKWSWDNFQHKWLAFWHSTSKSGDVESDIILIEEAIKEEKLKVIKINKELMALGLCNDINDGINGIHNKQDNQIITNNNTMSSLYSK